MKRRILLLTLGLVFLVNPLYAAETLKISGLPNYPPVMWKHNGTLTGIAAELAETICAELGVPFKFIPLPWTRALYNAENGAVDMIAGAYINKDRQRYMDYSLPFMKDPGVVFVMKEKSFPFKELKDLTGKKGVTMLGYSWGEDFDNFAKQTLNIKTVTKPDQAFRMLERGRVDYFIYGLYSGIVVAVEQGLDRKIEYLPNYVSEEDLYITFSKKSKFRHFLPRVNEIIERLKFEGTIKRWIKKYLEYFRKTGGNTG
jgi:polar amino acid transport system substrate-binding protein